MKPSGRVIFWLAVIMAAALLAGCRFNRNPAQDSWQTAGWHEGSIQAGSLLRWYRIYVPARLADPAPVVLVLHGGTQSMRKIFEDNAGGTQAWLDVAEGEGLLLVVPNGTNADTGDAKGDNQNWNDLRPDNVMRGTNVDDVGFINSLLDWVKANYRVNSGRVYVTGASNGGMMTYRLLVETPRVCAAGAAFIASLPENASVLKQPSRPTPLLIANGTRDPLVKWEGGEVAKDNGRVLAVEKSLAWWLAANHVDQNQVARSVLADVDPRDGCRITETAYPPAPGGAPVVFYQIEGGGHSMPSIKYPIPKSLIVSLVLGPQCHDAEGVDLAWNFMKDKLYGASH
jgi:polyhydroxybutyrate depolymerase